MLGLLTSSFAHSFTLENSIFEQVAKENQLDPLLLYSVALQASSKYLGHGLVSPSPYVVRSRHFTKYFKSPSEAKTALVEVLKTTEYVDVGLMQINVHYHPQTDATQLLDPYYNLTVGAKLLRIAMKSSSDPIVGVGRYFGWGDDEESREYGQQVWSRYNNLSQYLLEQGGSQNES